MMKQINNPQSNRIEYLDFLRGWAVIFMIFWHTIDALLNPALKNSFVFNIAQFLGGLVAPSFLFAAGSSFTIILYKSRKDILFFEKRAIKQLFKIFQIFLIAYLLHFPFKNLSLQNFSLTSDEYLNFIKVDILHIIAFGLLFMQVLFFITRKENIFFYLITFVSLLIIFCTPYIKQTEFLPSLPVEAATFLNDRYYSLFPIFPWLSYILLGSVVMHIIMTFKNDGSEEKIIKFFSQSGIIFVAFGVVFEILNIKTSDYYDFWLTSPNIFLIKIGIIFIIIYFLYYAVRLKEYKMKIFNIFGRESLFIYVVHLLIVYGSENPTTLSFYFGKKCNWMEFFIIYFVLLIFMLILAKGWHILKSKNILGFWR